jgi:penicillin-binding protein 1C
VEVPICWPLGKSKTLTEATHCHREKKALTINGVTPPTLRPLPHDNFSNPVTIWIDQVSGKMVDSNCKGVVPVSKSIAVWPKAIEPFLPANLRRQTLLPRQDKRCVTPIAIATGQIEIIGIRDGSRLRAQSGQKKLPRISLQSVGGQGSQQWFVNGKWVATTVVAGSALYQFETTGEHQLIVIDESGNSARITVYVERD